MKKYIIPLLVLSSGIWTTQAQLRLPEVLKTPIEAALHQSKDLRQKEIEIEKTILEQKKIKSKYIPTLEATAGYAYLDGRATVDIPGVKIPGTGYELFADKTTMDYQAQILHGGLMAKSVLFSGFQIPNAVKALNEKIQGDALLMETDKDMLIVDVVHSLDQLRFVETSEQLLLDSRLRLDKEEQRVNKGIANGLAVPFDRDKITLARLELESKQTELEGSKDLLFQKIKYLTGLPKEKIVAITYTLEHFALTDDLLLNRQELEALEHYKNAKKYLLKKEKGSYLPQALAFAGVSYTSVFNGDTQFQIPNLPNILPQPHLALNELTLAPNWMAGVLLKWEIFGGTARKHAVQQASLEVEQMENKMDDSKEKLHLQLSQKLVSYQIQNKKIALANQQEQVAKNALDMAAKQYVQGLISINQRLEAENDYMKAAQGKVEILINQRRAAMEAQMASGKLSQNIFYY